MLSFAGSTPVAQGGVDDITELLKHLEPIREKLVFDDASESIALLAHMMTSTSGDADTIKAAVDALKSSATMKSFMKSNVGVEMLLAWERKRGVLLADKDIIAELSPRGAGHRTTGRPTPSYHQGIDKPASWSPQVPRCHHTATSMHRHHALPPCATTTTAKSKLFAPPSTTTATIHHHNPPHRFHRHHGVRESPIVANSFVCALVLAIIGRGRGVWGRTPDT